MPHETLTDHNITYNIIFVGMEKFQSICYYKNKSELGHHPSILCHCQHGVCKHLGIPNYSK